MAKKGDICNEVCPKCGRNLIILTANEASCPKGHGPLIQWFTVQKKIPVKKGDK